MKVVNTGSTLRIFPDDLTVTDTIPVGTYQIQFNEMMGYSLVKTNDFVHTGRVYGDHLNLVDKISSRYELAERNFGTILGGRKGTGKSMTARIISEKLIERGIPTIMVTDNTPGLSRFLQSIEQPVFVLIDEFEKVFPCNDDGDEQAAFLSVFDGFHPNKHFYLITINEYDKLNKYFIGRTGRFYYDITFGKLSMDEIKDYIQDTVEEQYIKPTLVSLLYRLNTNYDQLNAISRELNLGENIENILKYLNLGLHESRIDTYMVTYTMKNGYKFEQQIRMDILYPVKHLYVDENYTGKNATINYDFHVEIPAEAYDFHQGIINVDMSQIKIEDYNMNSKSTDVDSLQYAKATDLESITFIPYKDTFVY